MSTKLCDRCKRRIKAEAASCICGWSASGAVDFQPRAVIACCYSGCPEGAICRMFTKTGWANVCLTHYPKLETVPLRSNSPVVVEARKAYEESFDYRRRHGIVKAPPDRAAIDAELEEVRRKMAASMERQPGQDDEPALGIPLDDFERELGERSAA